MEFDQTAAARNREGVNPEAGADRRAIIDVGTNSVKLLVAEVSGAAVSPLLEQSEQTRLGAGLYTAHRLQDELIRLSARVVADFAATARRLGAGRLRVIATSAARDAHNRGDLLQAIRDQSGLAVEVLSGQQEGRLAFLGVASQREFSDQPLLTVEIGGGSTQLILGQGGQERFCQSYALGTVRLLESLALTDPPTATEFAQCRRQLTNFLQDRVRPTLAPALRGFPPGHVKLVGTGGTTTILARMALGMSGFDRARIEALSLNRPQVRRQRERLWRLPLAERKRLVGLPPDRADVILIGVAIVEEVMSVLGFAVVRTSTRGLRFGAILEA